MSTESQNQDPQDKQLLAAQEIVTKHTVYAMGSSLIPIPILDLAAVTAVQLDMVKTLSHLFGADYSEDSGKTLIGALTGNIFARIGASFLKGIPVFGSILGGVSLVALSGAATYALGQVYVRHVSDGGSLGNLNPEDYKEFFRQRYEEGKKKAEQWKTEAEQTARDIEVDFSDESDANTGKKGGSPSDETPT
ncbi:MAG: DUF697 domain-containing protein [Bacteroidia bacterium]|nr:DUF697 domain-containing protein [Bacteroidia bacterium]